MLCVSMTYSLLGFSDHGILQARILEWLPCPPPGDLPAPGIKVKVKLFCCVQLFATLWTVAYQASPSMGFPRQEHQSGVPLPSPPRGQTCIFWVSCIGSQILYQKCHLGNPFSYLNLKPIGVFMINFWKPQMSYSFAFGLV